MKRLLIVPLVALLGMACVDKVRAEEPKAEVASSTPVTDAFLSRLLTFHKARLYNGETLDDLMKRHKLSDDPNPAKVLLRAFFGSEYFRTCEFYVDRCDQYTKCQCWTYPVGIGIPVSSQAHEECVSEIPLDVLRKKLKALETEESGR